MFDSTSVDKADALPSPLSDCSCSTGGRIGLSDEEIILATSRPKKRAGRRIFKETRHPVYRGVRRRNNNKWVCELREPNKKTRIWLGTYPTPEMAARAHDVAALALRGKSACLNFADSAWRLPMPSSKDAKEIRRVAAEAAESFRPRQVEEVATSTTTTTDHHHHVSNENNSQNTELQEEDVKRLQENVYVPEKVIFMDEEAVFDMPRLLVDMAEGLLLSPPHLGDDLHDWNMDSQSDSLWSYSI